MVTPNHNYNSPDKGTADWHVPLNNNFERLDLDVEIRDLEKDKSNYEPRDGAKYEATDSGAVYYGDGDQWVLADQRANEIVGDKILTKQFQSDGPLIVSPSIDAGYDSLQVALNDAAAGKSNEIWITENIQENVIIPNSTSGTNWSVRGGLKIRGVGNTGTRIVDSKKDGTPIIEVEGRIRKLTLENLVIQPDGADTRAFSQPSGTLPLARFSSCRFEAPVILFKLFHSIFEDCVFRARVSTDYTPNPDQSGITYNTSASLIVKAGNQTLWNRCSFISSTGDLEYGALWLMGASCALFNQCFWTIDNNGYNESAGRPVAPLLIDTGGDMLFNLPYVEQDADFSMVTDDIEGGGSTVDNIHITHSRMGSIKLNNRVKGLEIDGLCRPHTVDLNDGLAAEGSWIRDSDDKGDSINIEDSQSGNGKYLRVYEGRPKGFGVTQESVPTETGIKRRNDYSVPILVYQSGATGTQIRDYHGNERTLPDPCNQFVLGLNEQVSYGTSPPDEWTWYGME